MKKLFNARAPAFDAEAINSTIQRALASAGLDTASGPMRTVTETIRRALAAGGAASAAPTSSRAGTIDVAVRVVPEHHDASGPTPQPTAVNAAPPPRRQQGAFETRQFTNHAGTRTYKVFVPSDSGSKNAPLVPRPMIVMLHGCTQSADDFAAGTQMNLLAQQQGFLVVYPEQTAQANASRGWNWFRQQDQMSGAGEPAVIAGIVREAAEQHGADPHRIFVAGLSAGAAMALVLGETYPDLFAGVGVHSGLPYGSAHDIPSALTVMKGGRSGMPGLNKQTREGAPARKQAAQAVPAIVFHGDRDHTVHHSNGAHIVQQVLDAHGALQMSQQTGVASGGRAFSRVVHADAAGTPQVEHWALHGAGHAWSGGSAQGSFTDGNGPDASAEMVRFFLALPAGGSA